MRGPEYKPSTLEQLKIENFTSPEFRAGSSGITEGFKSRGLASQVTKQVNRMAPYFIIQKQGEFVDYLVEGQKPFPGTDITQIRGRYRAITTDLIAEIHHEFDLEVSSADPNLGISLLGFSRVEGGIRLWDEKRYHYDKVSDSTHEQIPPVDQVKVLQQTLTVLRHINDVTLGEDTRGWLEKAREKRAYQLAKRKLEERLTPIAEGIFPETTDYNELAIGKTVKVVATVDYEDDVDLIGPRRKLYLHFNHQSVEEQTTKPVVVAFVWAGKKLYIDHIAVEFKLLGGTKQFKTAILTEGDRELEAAMMQDVSDILNFHNIIEQ